MISPAILAHQYSLDEQANSDHLTICYIVSQGSSVEYSSPNAGLEMMLGLAVLVS